MIDENRHTFFLKVNDYQKKYLNMRYGSPVCFPPGSIMQLYLRRYLVRNGTMKRTTEFSCSYAAFNLKSSNQLLFSDYQPIKDDERIDFIEIEAPEKVMYGGKMVKVNQFFQLNPQGTRLIRKEIMNEFWMAFSEFRDECIFRASRLGKVSYTEDIMSDFMNMYNIEMEKFETMMRNWRRMKKKIKGSIENKRDKLEDKSGKSFIYT